VLRATYGIAGVVLLAGLSFAVMALAPSGSAGVFVLWVWAFMVGALSLVFVKLIEGQSGDGSVGSAPMVMAGLAMLLEWGLKELIAAPAGAPTAIWYDAAAVFVAIASAAGLESLVAARGKRTCFICKLQIDGPSAFTCPRCHQTICVRPSCWIGRHFRCRYCDDRDVVIFPMHDEPWWRARVGGRVRNGACGSCFKEAGEADLRACAQCSWPMCKRCWDYHNGRCSRCEWVMPDLPPPLRPFVAA
jgi:hypothetical protein